jgi:hypothetical protein
MIVDDRRVIVRMSYSPSVRYLTFLRGLDGLGEPKRS